MRPTPAHQRKWNSSLFGLLAKRLLFKGPSKGPHQVPDDDVSGAEKMSKEKQEVFKNRLKELIEDYNKQYGEDAEGQKDEFVYQNLEFYPFNLAKTKAQIEQVKLKLGEKAGAEGWRPPLKENAQYKQLAKMELILKALPEVQQKVEGDVEQAHRGRLAQRHERLVQAIDRKKGWKKRPVYQALKNTFEALASRGEFREMFMSSEGIATQNQREAQELFFAIMAEKTNGFRNGFVLGDKFGNDPAENIRNFPFIYNEFLKHEGATHKQHVSLEKLRNAESAAAEAGRKIQGVRGADEIIQANLSGGAQPLPAIPAVPDTKGWGERHRLLNKSINNLNERAAQEKDLAQKEGWTKAAEELKVHLDHADAYLKLSRLKDREGGVKARFTRIELDKRPKLVMDLAMKKFMKAMDIVDRPMTNAKWQGNLHPTVRRMLIASLYENGVATYKKDAEGNLKYDDEIKDEMVWMLSALSLSDYFSFKEVGEHMDADHTAVLKAAYLGSRIASLVGRVKEVEEVLEGLQQSKKDKNYDRMKAFPATLVARFENYSEAELQKTIDETKANRAKLEQFMKATRAAIQNPYSEESKKFIKDIREDKYKGELAGATSRLGELANLSDASLHAYEVQMRDLQINFKTAELQDKNDLMFFEGLGMNIEGLEPAYLAAIQKNPDLKVEYWNDLLMGTPAQFNKLIALLQTIIPENDAGGKADFIAGLKSLRKKYGREVSMTDILASQEEGSEDGVIINIFQQLQQHLKERARAAAFGARKQKEIQARLNGMHVGDKISKYVGGVWDMLTGPGQSWANRGAGLVLMYGFYKAARKAMKGEGKSGMLLRAAFVGTAIEIAAKEITGRGILDRMGLDAIAGAMEGSYEAVLLQDAEKNMEDKDITPEAHSAALYELNDVPFDQVMAWYEGADNNGMPRSKDDPPFPPGINLNKIGPKVTWEVKDKKLEARRVVWETVRHFFTYVGAKENKKGHDYAKEALKERWVTMWEKRNDSGYQRQVSVYDNREFFKNYRVQKKDITWQMVMRAEIDPVEAKLTHNKTPMGKLEATAKDWYQGLSEWAREYVYNPGSTYVAEFMDDMGEHAQDAKQFLSEAKEWAGRKLYFGKERVVLWYGEHRYEIRRVAEDHWNLLVMGVKMPFKVIYAVDQWAIPWTVAKLKGIENILSRNKTVSTDRDLDPHHISSNPVHFRSQNEKLNPEFSFFGVHQEAFMNALTKEQNGDRRVKKKPWFHKDADNVGYFISEVTPKDAGVDPNDPVFSGSPANEHSKVMVASTKKAETMFRQHSMSHQEIEKHMYAIHTYVKTTEPKKVYVFWRMPLKDSKELHMKETGNWSDYMDPNNNKDRESFEVDPRQTSWENMKRMFALDMGPARTLAAGVGKYAAQLPKFFFFNADLALKIAEDAGANADTIKAIKESNVSREQFVDEVFSSATNHHMATSEFYKKPENAKMYKFSLDFAHRRSKPLYLGLLEGEEGYEGSMYLEKPEADIYADMLKYYNEEWVPANGKDTNIESRINAKMQPQQTP